MQTNPLHHLCVLMWEQLLFPNRKHLNCKGIYSSSLPVGSGYCERVAGPLHLGHFHSHSNENIWRLRKWSFYFHTLEHMSCVRVQRASWSYLCPAFPLRHVSCHNLVHSFTFGLISASVTSMKRVKVKTLKWMKMLENNNVVEFVWFTAFFLLLQH